MRLIIFTRSDNSLLLPATLLLLIVTHNLNSHTINAKQIESALASQHFKRILKEAKCQVPVPRVVNIQELFPSATKKYIPHCTLLHMCGPESGCCNSETEKCVPKKVQLVDLYFWTIELSGKTRGGQKKAVEVISMQNHTECECKPINDLPR